MWRDIDPRAPERERPELGLGRVGSYTEMESGQVLRVVATDPGAVRDFEAFARQTGNELLSKSEGEEEFEFFFKRR